MKTQAAKQVPALQQLETAINKSKGATKDCEQEKKAEKWTQLLKNCLKDLGKKDLSPQKQIETLRKIHETSKKADKVLLPYLRYLGDFGRSLAPLVGEKRGEYYTEYSKNARKLHALELQQDFLWGILPGKLAIVTQELSLLRDKIHLSLYPSLRLKLAAFKSSGRYRASGDDLEGLRYVRSYIFLKHDAKKFLRKFKKHLSKSEIAQFTKLIQNLREATEPCYKFSLSRDAYRVNDDLTKLLHRINEIRHDYYDAIRKMKVGGYVLIPGRIFDDTGGHAIAYEIGRDSKTHYRFVLINTQTGYRENIADDRSTDHLSYAGKVRAEGVTQLSLKEVLDKELWMSILLPQVLHGRTLKDLWNPDVELPDNNMPLLYWKLRTHFKSIGKSFDWEGPWYLTQTNGTCTMSCLMAWARRHLSSGLYSLFEQFLTREGTKSTLNLRHWASLSKHREGEVDMEFLRGKELLNGLLKNAVSMMKEQKAQTEKVLKKAKSNPVFKHLTRPIPRLVPMMKKITSREKKESMQKRLKRVYCSWFGEQGMDKSVGISRRNFWLAQDDSLWCYKRLEKKFSKNLTTALDKNWEQKAKTVHERLSLIILFYGMAQYFSIPKAQKEKAEKCAIKICLDGMKRKEERALRVLEQYTYYLPLIYTKDMKYLEQSCKALTLLTENAFYNEEQKQFVSSIREGFIIRKAKLLQ